MTNLFRTLACILLFCSLSFAQLQGARVKGSGNYGDRPGRCEPTRDLFLCTGTLCKGPVYTCNSDGQSWNPLVPFSSVVVAATAQTASISSTNIATSLNPGFYRLTVVAETTTAAASGSGCSIAATVTYTDEAGSSTDTLFTGFSTAALGRQKAADYFYLASGTVSYAVTRTAGSCAGDTYAFRAVLEQVN